MQKGDIVLIPFPFTDLTGSKKRPALILLSGNLDVTVSFISTQLNWQEHIDLLLQPTETNGLKMPSLVRIRKIATIDKALVIGKLGNILDEEKWSWIRNCLRYSILKISEIVSHYQKSGKIAV